MEGSMQPGDLRQFSPKAYAPAYPNIGGKTFMVLAVNLPPERMSADLLLDGKVMERWNIPWLEVYSETINAAG
jgi:hypothetical protein